MIIWDRVCNLLEKVHINNNKSIQLADRVKLNVEVKSNKYSSNYYQENEPNDAEDIPYNMYGVGGEDESKPDNLETPEEEELELTSSDSEDKEIKPALTNWDTKLRTFLTNTLNPITEEITKLLDSFTETASTYGKMIIAESHMSNEIKKLQPADIGGIAGGSKFKVHDLFFKFPTDTLCGKRWLYGEYQRDDILSGKACNHDLKGLSKCFIASRELNLNFNFPLFALLDYQGFRLTVMTTLPLSGNSLVYGSGDGGKTVNFSHEIHEKLVKIGNYLHLRPHIVENKEKPMALCGDIEIHRIRNNYTEEKEEFIYILDLARVFPPVHPNTETKKKNLNTIFYRLFRPEYFFFFFTSKITICKQEA